MIIDERIDEILKTVPRGITLLNIGCAQNPEIHYALSAGNKSVGIDINKSGIAKMQKKGHDVRLGNAENYKLNQKFDYILATEVIEHLSNPGNFLDCSIKHLAKGGRMIITTPNISSILLYTLVVMFDKTQDITHVNYYDKKNLQVLLSRYGLKFATHKYIPPKVKLIGNNFFFNIMFFISTIVANLGFLVSPRLFGSYMFCVIEKD